MEKRKHGSQNWGLVTILLCACCFLSGGLVSQFLSEIYGKEQYRFVEAFIRETGEQLSLEEQELVAICKESLQNTWSAGRQQEESPGPGTEVLASYGYGAELFAEKARGKALLVSVGSIFMFLLSYLGLIHIGRKQRQLRISELTRYLEQVDAEREVPLIGMAEDEFACLQDGIQKTVERLDRTKVQALKDKERLAENLADISHQIKTFVTSISLKLELEDGAESRRAIKKQLGNLEQLLNQLLALSRIDAGVLKLERKPVDVYTLLSLTEEVLEGILMGKNLQVCLPNHPQVSFMGDLDWSMEAFLNLMKNCAEHTPGGGKICLDYSRNPLYTEITVEDEGEGFTKEELSHVFERFYQGQGRKKDKKGAGIGLSLAKSIVEQQNGTIRAENRQGGGAVFTVRFYCH